MSQRTTDVRCHDCGTQAEVALDEDGTPGSAGKRTGHEFTLQCDACGAEWEGRYRAETETIVWQ